MNVQIFVYNCVYWKKEKQHSQNLSHFENESTFQKDLLIMSLPKGIRDVDLKSEEI